MGGARPPGAWTGGHLRTHSCGGASGTVSSRRRPGASSGAGVRLWAALPPGLAEAPVDASSTKDSGHTSAPRFARCGGQVAVEGGVPVLKFDPAGTLRLALGGRAPWEGSGLYPGRVPSHACATYLSTPWLAGTATRVKGRGPVGMPCLGRTFVCFPARCGKRREVRRQEAESFPGRPLAGCLVGARPARHLGPHPGCAAPAPWLAGTATPAAAVKAESVADVSAPRSFRLATRVAVVGPHPGHCGPRVWRSLPHPGCLVRNLGDVASGPDPRTSASPPGASFRVAPGRVLPVLGGFRWFDGPVLALLGLGPRVWRSCSAPWPKLVPREWRSVSAPWPRGPRAWRCLPHPGL